MADQLSLMLAQSLIKLDRNGESLRDQIYRQLRDAVLCGRLTPGSPLPSTRDLAAALKVARSTLVEAIDQLKAEGFLETRQGAPMRVAKLDRKVLGARLIADRSPDTRSPRERTDLAENLNWCNDDPPTPVTLRAFRPGLPDIRAFPAREWATHLARRARHPASHDLSYSGYSGVQSLREEILRHVSVVRHVQAQPEQVVILPSSQAAFDLVTRCSLQAGEVAWVEDPGYPGIRALLRSHRAIVVPIAVDREGIQTEGVRSRPRLIYVTPSHQYPTGVAMSLQRRLKLLNLAQQFQASIIEDDYDSEFHYQGQPIASLQGLDSTGCVHYVGTFSKTMAPGLHVAYVIVPLRFVDLAHTIASTSGVTVSVHVQLALADFMHSGGLRRHIRAMTNAYAKRMAALCASLRRYGGNALVVPSARGGLQLCVELHDAIADTLAVEALREAGVHALPLSELSFGQRRNGLILGVGLVEDSGVVPAARNLCNVLGRLLSQNS
jgi:GntR family transcriptional regulator/MocR family aminotransferase